MSRLRDSDRPPRKRLKAIDLFAGPGGMTAGLKDAGYQVIAAVEIDKDAVATYKANHPRVRVFRIDIKDLPARRVMKSLGLQPGELDLLAGCPPCQGFSTLTTLNGSIDVDDPRNDLINDYVRFVRVMRPKALLMENVPGLLRDPRMADVLETLELLGYPVKSGTRVVDAAGFDVPQHRRRMVLMSVKGKPVPFPVPKDTQVTVRDAFTDMPKAGASGDAAHDHGERRRTEIVELIRLIPKNGGSRASLGPDRQLACHQKTAGFYDIYGRMSWDRPAPTITSGCTNPSKGRFLHPDEDRAITLREAAVLQGFDRKYKFDISKGKESVAAMIGNALPPPFVSAHAKAIARILRPYERAAAST